MTATQADLEKATKTLHSASFLVSDLRELVKTDNMLLSEIALRELETAVEVELRLKRLVSILEQQK